MEEKIFLIISGCQSVMLTLLVREKGSGGHSFFDFPLLIFLFGTSKYAAPTALEEDFTSFLVPGLGGSASGL